MINQHDKLKAALERLKYSMHLAENKLRDARESFNDALAALSTPQPAATVSVEELEKFIVEKTICPMDEIYYGTTACRMWAKRAAVAVLSRLNITPAEATPAKEPGKTLGEVLFQRRWPEYRWERIDDSTKKSLEDDASAVIAAFLDSISETQIASLSGPFDTNDARRILNYLKQRAAALASEAK